MKIIKRIAVIWVILVIVSLIGCIGEITVIKKSYKDSFKATYTGKTDFYQYCDNGDSYILGLEMRNCQVKVILKREDETWAGDLSLYESRKLVESIPISIVDDQIVIHSDNEKRIDLDSLLLYHIDAGEGKIKRVAPYVVGYPNLSEVEIHFDPQKIADYMVSFYDNFIVEFTDFKYKDIYFACINNFKSAVYNEYRPQNHAIYYSLGIGFEGKEEFSWDPGFGNFGDVSVILKETSPMVW